jgi:beta-galactosidase
MAKAWEYRKKNRHPANRYRLMWMDVKYEPGSKVVAFDDNGKAVAEEEVHTAGSHQIV